MELDIDDVSKRHGREAWGLRNASLRLQPGLFGLLGPNGAGKSTLMRILATVTQPTTGTASWNGVDVTLRPNALRSVLGYLPQDFGVYPSVGAGAAFLPALALFLGVSSGSPRPFQVVCLILWYLGPMNGVVAFDLAGSTAEARAAGVPWWYLVASGLLFGPSWIVRLLQTRPPAFTVTRAASVLRGNRAPRKESA